MKNAMLDIKNLSVYFETYAGEIRAVENVNIKVNNRRKKYQL